MLIKNLKQAEPDLIHLGNTHNNLINLKEFSTS